MSFLQILGSLLGIVKEYLSGKNKEVELQNTKDMKERKAAQKKVDSKSHAEKLVGDVVNGTEQEKQKALDEIRRHTAS